MKTFFKIHILIALTGFLAVLFFTPKASDSTSFLFGALLILGNVAFITYVCKEAIHKKSVALVVSAIVLKYPLLGASVYLAFRFWNLSGIWVAGGVTTLLATVVLYGVVRSTNSLHSFAGVSDSKD